MSSWRGPQELIDAIISEVKDISSLKACALAASECRVPAQRTLLSSLTLEHSWSPDEACVLLRDSPHVAKYITRLCVRMHPGKRSTDTLRELLGKLTNVRKCTIRGDVDGRDWGSLRRTALPVIEFARRQNVAELHVLFIDALPLRILALLISSAPILSFYDVWIGVSAEPVPLVVPALMEQLLVRGPVSVLEALGRTKFASYIAKTLEHIHFQDISLVPSLSSVLRLRSVDLGITVMTSNGPALLAKLSSICNSCPATLRQINISVQAFNPAVVLNAAALSALDVVLFRCHASPVIRWRLDFDTGTTPPIGPVKIAAQLAQFTVFMQAGLPQMAAAGRLIVERYLLGGDTGEWAIR
ncbi:hypothetical protein DFH06DRAFT_1480682 [Mycena polygramma]|nr:hypothetical protein DFH06DRAFT_1480682 [Mycena polygramma]